MIPGKAIGAALAGVTTGAGFILSAGVLHGTVLVLFQAGLAALDTVGGSYAVFKLPKNISVNSPVNPKHQL